MRRSFVCFFMTICMMFLSTNFTTVQAASQCGEDVYWSLDEQGVMTISGTGDMWDMVIKEPDRDIADYEGYHINPWYEERMNIKEVVIESGVTLIGNFAFFECENVEKVTFADTLTRIGHFAFTRCRNMENYTLPESLRSIGQEAFAECEKVTKVVIPDNVSFLDAGIFSMNSQLTEVYIGGSADIGMHIYGNCPFRNCVSLEAINVSPDHIALASHDGILYNKENGELVQYPAGKKDKKVILPDIIKSIMQFGIEGVLALEEIVLPEGMTVIGNTGIADCPKLKSITIPSTVETIENAVGAYCTELEYVENKSDAAWQLAPGGGVVWTDEAGNTLTSINKGKAYQHGAAYGVYLDTEMTLK